MKCEWECREMAKLTSLLIFFSAHQKSFEGLKIWQLHYQKSSLQAKKCFLGPWWQRCKRWFKKKFEGKNRELLKLLTSSDNSVVAAFQRNEQKWSFLHLKGLLQGVVCQVRPWWRRFSLFGLAKSEFDDPESSLLVTALGTFGFSGFRLRKPNRWYYYIIFF